MCPPFICLVFKQRNKIISYIFHKATLKDTEATKSNQTCGKIYMDCKSDLLNVPNNSTPRAAKIKKSSANSIPRFPT